MFSKAEMNRLYRYCVALTHDETVAFDLLHDAILKVLGGQRMEMRNREAFMKVVIKNLFIDHKRAERVRAQKVVDFGEIVQGDDSWLDTKAIDKITLEEILSKMTPEERELLFLNCVEGKTAQEIATENKVPRGTILSRLHRIKAKFKNRPEHRIGLGERK